uniref:prolyl oligopeptidase n=1 Tax=uncultured Nocardioidaceae bacterium TaxID=253824 RepID=A0A6J4KUP0_9ACTN|nr:MAG: Prolyl endopeptidase [uncultured Nocardioidaceae bacterium]
MTDAPTHPLAYPPAPREDLVDEVHGERVPDPYRWLEDGDSDETVRWQQAQDELLEAARSRWSTREPFADRIAQLLRTGHQGPPVWRGDRSFSTRRLPDQEHAVVLVHDADGSERVLVDPMSLDPDGLVTLDAWQPSKDGRFLAYQVSASGTEESVLHLLDVATGAAVDAPIERCRYSPVAWLSDSAGFYYVRSPAGLSAAEARYHRRVWLHLRGTSPDEDTVVFGEDHDKTTIFGLQVSLDGRWLVVSAALGTAPRNDVWLADLMTAGLDEPVLRPVVTGLDARTGLWVGRDGRMYVHTDADAPRGRLLVGRPEEPEPGHWRELVAQDPEAVLEDVAILDADDGPALLCSWTRHAVSELTRHDAVTGARTGTVALPGLGSVGGLVSRPEGGSEVWFSYTDHVTPVRVLHHDLDTGDTDVHALPPGDVPDTGDVRVEQVAYESLDGETVRMFVLRSAAAPDGPRPTILYGYGGFGISLTPAYSASALAWLQAGGSYAIANLRGGSEEGESWHRAGMREHKQRVFDDLHAGAERLVDDGVTRPDLLAIHGGSNGGLLVGAALTQRPDLYAAVVCSAPLLDMVRYEAHGMGQLWSDEYGSASDPEELRWLLTYSPYHRVRPGTAYPAVLFTVFASDSRVDPLHARKMAAALQHATSSDRPVLMRLERDVGHGARSVTRTAQSVADTLAFTAWATGLTMPPGRS